MRNRLDNVCRHVSRAPPTRHPWRIALCKIISSVGMTYSPDDAAPLALKSFRVVRVFRGQIRASAAGRFRNSTRRVLPLMVWGSSFTNSISRGYL